MPCIVRSSFALFCRNTMLFCIISFPVLFYTVNSICFITTCNYFYYNIIFIKNSVMCHYEKVTVPFPELTIIIVFPSPPLLVFATTLLLAVPVYASGYLKTTIPEPPLPVPPCRSRPPPPPPVLAEPDVVPPLPFSPRPPPSCPEPGEALLKTEPPPPPAGPISEPEIFECKPTPPFPPRFPSPPPPLPPAPPPPPAPYAPPSGEPPPPLKP